MPYASSRRPYARHVDYCDDRALLFTRAIRIHDLTHRARHFPSFDETDLAAARPRERIVRIGHHGDEARGMVPQPRIDDPHRRRKTGLQRSAVSERVEPDCAALRKLLCAHN
jgi:hypothetical protein